MEERKRGIKALSIVALFAAVIALTVAFAALSRTLTINGTAEFSGNWDIHFENLSTVALTGDASETTAPTIKAHGTTGIANTEISNYEVKLMKPGDSVTYTFDVVNDGTINAKLGSFTMPTPTCAPVAVESPAVAATQAEANTLCGDLTYTLTYTEGGAAVAADDYLASGATKNMTLTLTYVNKTEEQTIPSNDVAITNLGFNLIYGQAEKTTTTVNSN